METSSVGASSGMGGEATDPQRPTLVLGYPRLLARELARAAMDDGQHVIVLVEPRERERAQTELAGAELLEGAATSLDLGLSGVEYNQLCERVRIVHHVPPRGRELRKKIVASTRELLELVHAARHLQIAVHHSSVQVFGERTGWIEEDTPIETATLNNAKEAALALAERMVTRAWGELPLCIARAGFSAGHAETGETETDSGIYLLSLIGLATGADLRLPFPGRGEWQLNLVPIDWVAAMSVRLAREPSAPRSAFHFVDPSPFSVRKVLELVLGAAARESRQGQGGGRFLPAGLTRALLRAPGLEPLVRSPREFLEAWLRDVRFSSLKTNALLMDAPLCPAFDEYVSRIVAHVAESARQGMIREPEAVEDALLG